MAQGAKQAPPLSHSKPGACDNGRRDSLAAGPFAGTAPKPPAPLAQQRPRPPSPPQPQSPRREPGATGQNSRPAPLCIGIRFCRLPGLRPESAAHRSVEQGPRLRGCDRAGARESRGCGAPSVALRGRIQAQCAWNLLRPPRDASLLDWPIFWILPASSASPSPILDRNAHVFHYVRGS